MTHQLKSPLLDDPQTIAADFIARREREQRRYHARKAKPFANILAQLITTRGYGRIQAQANFNEAWKKTVGDALAKFTNAGRLRRGVLEITAANSMTIQELTFQKQQILQKLQADVPDAKIRDLKFRVGSID